MMKWHDLQFDVCTLVGYRCAIIPGGIAEMYLVSDKSEGLFLRKRQNTVRAAIQEGMIFLNNLQTLSSTFLLLFFIIISATVNFLIYFTSIFFQGHT